MVTWMRLMGLYMVTWIWLAGLYMVTWICIWIVFGGKVSDQARFVQNICVVITWPQEGGIVPLMATRTQIIDHSTIEEEASTLFSVFEDHRRVYGVMFVWFCSGQFVRCSPVARWTDVKGSSLTPSPQTPRESPSSIRVTQAPSA